MLIFLSGIAAAAPADIPFRITRGMIVVDATIQGSQRSMCFILDSGAGETVLAKRTAADLELTVTSGERIRTVHGTENVSRAETTHIHLGGTTSALLFSARPLVVDLSSESRTLGSRIDGLLGVDFFQGRSIRIDFQKSRIHVSPDGKPGPLATKLPLTRSRGAMFVGLTAADSPLPRVRLDTGCCRSLCWTPPDGSSLGKPWSDGKTMKIDVNLGPLVMSDVATDVYRQPLFAGEDGLLGTALLSRFDSVWIDSVNNRIAFETVRD
ncbi:MAG: aspartyl protease family protein [Luteolibacter sp.]|uniref:aspartyl protease family protein n=1 Tax=Luteolibacter sp. TaxID=1962973 RepID=UPI003266FF1A